MADFEQTAYDFLEAGTNYQAPLRNTLVQAGARAVLPLLRAGIRRAQSVGEMYAPLLRTTELGDARSTFLFAGFDVSTSAIANDINSVCREIGQAGMTELSAALTNSELKIAFLSALVLLAQQGYTWQTMRKIADAYEFFESESKRRARSEEYRMLELLIILYSQEGIPQANEMISRAAMKEGVTAQQWQEQLRRAAWFYVMT